MSLETRLKNLERHTKAKRHTVLLWEEGASAPFDVVFLGPWQEAEKAAEISRLRAQYPGIPAQEREALGKVPA